MQNLAQKIYQKYTCQLRVFLLIETVFVLKLKHVNIMAFSDDCSNS